MPSGLMRHKVTDYIQKLQETIVATFEDLDSEAPRFKWDSWDRSEGGGGRSATFSVIRPSGEYTGGTLLEKAGVNISMIHGSLSAPSIKQMRTEHQKLPYDPNSDQKLPFFAAGISLIIHPRNPRIPAVHANYRYFEVTENHNSDMNDQEDANVLAWWFGGITDLTPMYFDEGDAAYFHGRLKAVCDTFSQSFYPAFKKNCDDYLFIPHRKEHRGIGGIRFDDLCDEPHRLLAKGGTEEMDRPRSALELFEFTRQCGDMFLPSYLPIIKRYLDRPNIPASLGSAQSARERRWQLLRRGHYIEFNLIYERGTKFGLATPGINAENVLMGMPPEARWEYQSQMGVNDYGEPDDSEEGRMLDVLRNPREWV